MLKDNWKDKQDGVDEILAKDINDIANAVIEIQEELNNIGDIDAALDSIIAIQNSLIGGDSE
jgi:hypothetical protein